MNIMMRKRKNMKKQTMTKMSKIMSRSLKRTTMMMKKRKMKKNPSPKRNLSMTPTNGPPCSCWLTACQLRTRNPNLSPGNEV